MRFNCQSCAAKYQIADEKVAGKTVRMKCRKCGAAIQVRPLPNGEAVHVGDTGSPTVSMVPPSDHSESLPPPPERPSQAAAPPPAETPLPRKVPVGPPTAASHAAPSGFPPRAPLPAPSALPRPPLPGGPPLANRALPPLPGAGARPSVGPPRPGLPPLGTAPPSPNLGASGPSAAAVPAPPVAMFAIPGPLPFPDEPSAPSGVAAGTLGAPGFIPPPQMSDPLVLTKVKADVGPLPGLPEAPRRDSVDPLGGFEEKVDAPSAEAAPLAAEAIGAPATAALELSAGYPLELPAGYPAEYPKADLADEATALFQLPVPGAPMAPASDVASEVAAALPIAPSGAALPIAPPGTALAFVPPGTALAFVPPGTGGAVPLGLPALGLAGSPALPLESVPSAPAFDGLSQPTALLEPLDTAALAAAAAEVAAAPNLPSEASPMRIERLSDFPEAESLADVDGHDRRKRHRGIHPAAWGLIAMCAALGGVAAWIFLAPSPDSKDAAASASSSRVVTVPIAGHSDSPSAATSATANAAGGVPTSGQAVAMGDAAGPAAQPGGTAGTTSGIAPIAGTSNGAVASEKTDKSSAKAAPPCDPKTDPLCSAVGGPDVGAGPGGRADSGAGLTQEQISATVSRNRGSVQRGCIPLVQSGAVKVNVTMTIGPSGSVSSVSTSGGGGNGGVVSCIRSKVSGWHFPASGGTTQVSVPFQLIAQN